MREPERPGNRKGLSEFTNLFCELFVGVLGNKNLLERYGSDTGFKTFVDDALHLYEACRTDVLRTYHGEGLYYFEWTVSSKVNAVRRIVE